MQRRALEAIARALVWIEAETRTLRVRLEALDVLEPTPRPTLRVLSNPDVTELMYQMIVEADTVSHKYAELFRVNHGHDRRARSVIDYQEKRDLLAKALNDAL